VLRLPSSVFSSSVLTMQKSGSSGGNDRAVSYHLSSRSELCLTLSKAQMRDIEMISILFLFDFQPNHESGYLTEMNRRSADLSSKSREIRWRLSCAVDKLGGAWSFIETSECEAGSRCVSPSCWRRGHGAFDAPCNPR
jgi:hypothetical protein